MERKTRNETNQNETKQNEMKRNETKRIEAHTSALSLTHHHHHHLLIPRSISYFIFDTAFIICKPSCVASPRFIIGHHIVSITGILFPYFRPQLGWSMCMCMSVEVSTWFLIFRRVIKQIFPGAWKVLHTVLTCCHYLAWFGVRVFVQNGVFVALVRQWIDEVERRIAGGQHSMLNCYFCSSLIGPPVQGILCLMNIKWTRDLINGFIKYGFLPKQHERKGL